MNIITKNAKERNFLINVAAAAGMKLHDGYNAETMEAQYPQSRFPSVAIYNMEQNLGPNSYRVTCSYRSECDSSLEDGLKYIASQIDVPPPISVVLNEKYIAVITGDTVIVGCQKFPKEKIKELYEAAYPKTKI
jgi:hypothetical protein